MKKIYALYPDEREKECNHFLGFAFTGRMPNTGRKRCGMCGFYADEVITDYNEYVGRRFRVKHAIEFSCFDYDGAEGVVVEYRNDYPEYNSGLFGVREIGCSGINGVCEFLFIDGMEDNIYFIEDDTMPAPALCQCESFQLAWFGHNADCPERRK